MTQIFAAPDDVDLHALSLHSNSLVLGPTTAVPVALGSYQSVGKASPIVGVIIDTDAESEAVVEANADHLLSTADTSSCHGPELALDTHLRMKPDLDGKAAASSSAVLNAYITPVV